jgi:long-chain acyl-CoA synthetase
MLIGRVLSETRKRTPDKIALWFGEKHWTYAELDDATDRIAVTLLNAGVRPGDRVALFMPNCPELVFSYFACFKIGSVCVPLNYRYRQAEARYALEHSGSTTLIAHQALVKEVDNLPLAAMGLTRCYLVGSRAKEPFAPFNTLLAHPSGELPDPPFDTQQLAAILYTSGTTSKPKGVLYSHSTLWHNCLIQASTMEFTPADVHLISTAACHAAAFTGQLLPNVYVGGTSMLTHLPTPEQVIGAIAAHGVTRTQMLPATVLDLVEHLELHPHGNLTSWQCCFAGGDVVPVEVQHRFRQATGIDITEVYGMTEALTCVVNPPFGEKRAGSMGKPASETRLRLVDEHGDDVPTGQSGELLVQSPAVMVGYWNDPKATALALRDGWLFTGDLVRRDKDGFYWFTGRKKEIIIHGGSNISPLEIEEVLAEHPAVHISCVVGWPDKHFGQIVAAYVSLRKEIVPQPTLADLRQFVADRLAAYKVPERLIILDEMPLNATGKVDRKKLHSLGAPAQSGLA